MLKAAARTVWRTALLLTFLFVCHLAPRIKASENAIGAPRGPAAVPATASPAEAPAKAAAVTGAAKPGVPAKRFRIRK